jgi:hypothetical protein
MQENLSSQQYIEDFYQFLETTHTGTLSTYKHKDAIMRIYDADSSAIDTDKVNGLITDKIHRIHEDLITAFKNKEQVDFSPKLLEIVLEELKSTQFKLGGQMRINIEIMETNKPRLLFE